MQKKKKNNTARVIGLNT